MTEDIMRKYAEIYYAWGFESVPVTLVSCEGLDQCIRGSQNLQAYLEVFGKILDKPLPQAEPQNKIPAWEKMSNVALKTHGTDFRAEAHSIFFGETRDMIRLGKALRGAS